MRGRRKGRRSSKKLKKNVEDKLSSQEDLNTYEEESKNMVLDTKETDFDESLTVENKGVTDEITVQKENNNEMANLDQVSSKSSEDSGNSFKNYRKEQRILMYARRKDAIRKAINDEIKNYNKYAQFEILLPKIDVFKDSIDDDMGIERDLEILGIN